MATDPRIDAYIDGAAPFARPILTHFRTLVHRTLPEVEEGIKWGMPAFMYGGKNIAGMAAFKTHCAIIVHGEGRVGTGEGMGGYGKIAELADLPPDAELAAGLRDVANRVAAGGAATRRAPERRSKPEIRMPEDFAGALQASGARDKFDAFPPGARREYLEWIVTAKRPETRARRIATAVIQTADGRKLNWKYEKC